MGNSWPGARGEPGRQAAHQPVQPSDAFALLKDRRGANWTTDMEAIVEYHIRTTWVEPLQKETQHQRANRLCAAYDDQETAMHEWINRPMGATPGSGQGQRGQAPANSEEPTQGAWGEQPKDDPKDLQSGIWGTRPQGRGWSHAKGSGWDSRAGAYDHADDRPETWGQRTPWDLGQRPGDPWHPGNSQGP